MSHRDVPVPKQLQDRPIDERGYVITYVTAINPETGKPDFRIINQQRVLACIKHRLCGLCGKEIGKVVAFIGGTESVKNRLFSDPPMHYECAEYATKVCPFLAHKNVQHTPFEDVNKDVGGGLVVVENPLAGMERPEKMAIYLTRTYKKLLLPASPGGKPVIPAIKAGKPVCVAWF